MDRTAERETRDFMNVESFSQLPFIRPAPSPRGGAGAIRLFGRDFSAKTAAASTTNSENENNNNRSNGNNEDNDDQTTATATPTATGSSRKFECHYCCRNFPTSQALGGHQNAHKRERQHAKRAHLQSAMSLSDPHVYASLMNYGSTRLGSAHLPLAYHPSWNNSSTRLYAGSRIGSFSAHHHHPTSQAAAPINGSPLATWRMPAAHGSSVFGSHDHQRLLNRPQTTPFGNKNVMSTGGFGSHESRFGYETKSGMQDHLSLDLHL